MKVKIDPRTYKVSKLPPSVIAKIADKMSQDPNLEPPRAKKKWLEMVDINGERFAVSCHEESGAAAITDARLAKKNRGGLPWRR